MSRHTTTEARAHQFEDAVQQQEAASLGMWIFLSTEALFFGAILLGYAIYRRAYFESFAEASGHLDVVLGTANTMILLCSSLTMAFAVHESRRGNDRGVIRYLSVTMFLGATFLGIKFYEYYEKYREGLIPGAAFQWEGEDPTHASLFFVLYFALTGLHALHMIVGIGLLSLLLVRTRMGSFSSAYNTPIDLGGLYWHFVDIVWVFLFPLLYLVDRTS
jgi:cytochrome c oxidase subunit 3